MVQFPQGDFLTYDEAAELAGIKKNTFTAYVQRKQAPGPELSVLGHPLFRKSVIEEWIATRPGSGRWTASRIPTG